MEILIAANFEIVLVITVLGSLVFIKRLLIEIGSVSRGRSNKLRRKINVKEAGFAIQ